MGARRALDCACRVLARGCCAWCWPAAAAVSNSLNRATELMRTLSRPSSPALLLPSRARNRSNPRVSRSVRPPARPVSAIQTRPQLKDRQGRLRQAVPRQVSLPQQGNLPRAGPRPTKRTARLRPALSPQPPPALPRLLAAQNKRPAVPRRRRTARAPRAPDPVLHRAANQPQARRPKAADRPKLPASWATCSSSPATRSRA